MTGRIPCKYSAKFLWYRNIWCSLLLIQVAFLSKANYLYTTETTCKWFAVARVLQGGKEGFQVKQKYFCNIFVNENYWVEKPVTGTMNKFLKTCLIPLSYIMFLKINLLCSNSKRKTISFFLISASYVISRNNVRGQKKLCFPSHSG